MPLASKAQFRKLKALEREGKVPRGTASEWYHHTDSFDSLPERKAAALQQLAAEGNSAAKAALAVLKSADSPLTELPDYSGPPRAHTITPMLPRMLGAQPTTNAITLDSPLKKTLHEITSRQEGWNKVKEILPDGTTLVIQQPGVSTPLNADPAKLADRAAAAASLRNSIESTPPPRPLQMTKFTAPKAYTQAPPSMTSGSPPPKPVYRLPGLDQHETNQVMSGTKEIKPTTQALQPVPPRGHPTPTPLGAFGMAKQSASVGRNEGFGATNSMVTAGSSLMSPANLSKPPEPVPGQLHQPPVPLAKMVAPQTQLAPPVTGGSPVTAGKLSSPIKMQ